jgi:Tol biopolymer transport system component
MSMNSCRLGVSVALAAAVAMGLLSLVVATQPASAAFQGKNGKITFVRGTRAALATGEVWVMERDGSQQTRLTNNAVFDGLPAFSPDGERIAFTSRRESVGAQVNDEIFLMDPKDDDGDGNGDNLTRITFTDTENEFQPAFSPDGNRIAFTSSQNGNEIYVMDADGTNRVRLTDNAARDARPAFSPRGDRIAFTSNRPGPDGFTDDEIYVMDAADTDGDGNGDNLTQITDNTTVPVNDIPVLVNDTHANFSPDGEEVAFTSNRDSTALQQNDDIYLSNSDGSGTPTRLTNNPAVDEFPAFSPDGKRLAFSSAREVGNYDIYKMHVALEDPTSNNPVRLTDNPEIDSKPDWQPTAPPLRIGNARAKEGNTNARFTVSLSDASQQAVAVDYATANKSAKAPADYTAKTGTLTFEPGDTSKTVTVAIRGDRRNERNETFRVNLSNANTTIVDASGKGTIYDND